VKHIKQLSLQGFDVELELNPEDSKDITECALFFEGSGQRIKDLNRTSEYIQSLEKGKYTLYKTGGEHSLPQYQGRTDFPFIVNNHKNQILQPTFSRSVYPAINLVIDSKSNKVYLHRLVAMGFLVCPDVTKMYTVDHINEDKTDYSLNNLQWVTTSRNNSSVTNNASNKGKKYKVMSSENYVS